MKLGSHSVAIVEKPHPSQILLPKSATTCTPPIVERGNVAKAYLGDDRGLPCSQALHLHWDCDNKTGCLLVGRKNVDVIYAGWVLDSGYIKQT